MSRVASEALAPIGTIRRGGEAQFDEAVVLNRPPPAEVLIYAGVARSITGGVRSFPQTTGARSPAAAARRFFFQLDPAERARCASVTVMAKDNVGKLTNDYRGEPVTFEAKDGHLIGAAEP